MYENIIVETGDGIELITLNRPGVLNRLNIDMMSELRDAVEYAAASEDIRAVIITGAGGRAFSAGEDLEEMNTLTPPEARAMIANGQALMQEIELLPKPVIAAVEGYCFGSGFELALSADIRIISDSAVFCFPEASCGLIPAFGGARRLLRLAGAGRAGYYCMSGEWIDAEEALAMGLAVKITEAGELLEEAVAMASELIRQPEGSLAAVKRLIREETDPGPEDAVAFERKLFDSLFSDEKRAERLQELSLKQKN